MTLYAILLVTHSWVRWAVVALIVTILARCLHGWRAARAWSTGDERTHVAFVAFVDTQLFLGLWLYLQASPIVRAFLADPRAAMKVRVLRFFGLEHALMMLVAVVIIHVARVRSKKAGPDRHRRVATSTALALLVIAASIPWPPLGHGRPLFRAWPSTDETASACPPSYAERCVACHGAAGHGDGMAATSLTPRPRDFSDPKWWAAHRDEEIAAVIRDGGAKHGLSPAMPAQPDLGPADRDALVRCIRSFQSSRSSQR